MAVALRSSADVIAQTEPVARSTKVQVESVFTPNDLSNLILHLQQFRKTGTVMLDYSNGTLCSVRWNEKMKSGG